MPGHNNKNNRRRISLFRLIAEFVINRSFFFHQLLKHCLYYEIHFFLKEKQSLLLPLFISPILSHLILFISPILSHLILSTMQLLRGEQKEERREENSYEKVQKLYMPL